MSVSIKDAVEDVFNILGVGYKEMSVDDIALELSYKYDDFKDCNVDEIKSQVSNFLSRATVKTVKGKRVENKDSKYQRVKNKNGTFKRGYYKLRKPKVVRVKPTPLAIAPVETCYTQEKNYIGSAGEMAVCSELLFREYNVSRMSVDDGVDVVAIKNGKTFYIQVKTAQIVSKSFNVTIKTKSFQRYSANDCYYIVVARSLKNMFFIFTSDDIKRMITNGDINCGDRQISIQFSQSDGDVYVKNERVNYALNTFDRIV